MKPRVLLDCDGILANFVTPALGVVASLGGPVLSHDDLTDWDIDHLLPETQRAEYARLVAAQGFCRSLLPYAGAQEAVRQLRELADVVIVTASMGHCATWAYERGRWLADVFGIDPKREVVHTHAKYLIGGDVFIDDSAEHVGEWAAAHPRGTPLLWDRAYNRTSSLPRTSSWSTVMTVVREGGDVNGDWDGAPYVCPGCYAVGGERCAPGCIYAAIEAKRERDHEIYCDDDGEDPDGDE